MHGFPSRESLNNFHGHRSANLQPEEFIDYDMSTKL